MFSSGNPGEGSNQYRDTKQYPNPQYASPVNVNAKK